MAKQSTKAPPRRDGKRESPPSERQLTARPDRRFLLALLGAALVAAFAAFGPSIGAPFDFDDRGAIIENPTIREAWPPTALAHTPELGTAVSGRPIANYSFALNYALNRQLGLSRTAELNEPGETVAYHVVNIVLHALSAVLLFLLVRATLCFGTVPNELRARARGIAAAVAGVWLIHPIQTEAVDYVTQRTELLVSFFYLATLFAAQRAHRAPHRLRWSITSVVAAGLGMATKEVMITAPLIVLLYDRAFLFSSWRAMWADRSRRMLYAALAATTLVSLLLILNGARAGTVGFGLGVTPFEYLYSQAIAIPRYVGLMFWPDPLVYDYGQQPLGGPAGVLGAIVLVTAVVGSIVAWRSDRWRGVGFLGIAFFVLLAPSSSVVPIRTEIAAERRVYLAFALVALLVAVAAVYARLGNRRREAAIVLVAIYVLACGWTATRIAPGSLALQFGLRMILAAGAAALLWRFIFEPESVRRNTIGMIVLAALLARTVTRSAEYQHPRNLWLDVARSMPTNARAYYSLAGFDLHAEPPRFGPADSLFREAARTDSAFAPAWTGRAAIALKQARLGDAEAFLEHALRLSPGDSGATAQLAQIFVANGQPERALPLLRQVADRFPNGETLTRLGVAYLTFGQLDSASTALHRAVQLDSTSTDALEYLSASLVEAGRGADAVPYADRASRLDSNNGFPLGVLALAFAQARQPTLALQAADAAVRRSPNVPMVYVFAGRAMQTMGQLAQAAEYFQGAIRLDPRDPQALTHLGEVYATGGRKDEAVQWFQRALAVAPGYPLARAGIAALARR